MKFWRQDEFGAIIWTEDSLHAIAVEPQHWQEEAKSLWTAAKLLQEQADLPAEGMQLIANINLAVVAQMLRGMSLECQLKSIHFRRRIAEENGDVLKVGHKLHTHDLLSLAVEELSYRSIPLSEPQAKRLDLMGKMIVSNRYPVDTGKGKESISKGAAFGPHVDDDLRLLFEGMIQAQLNEAQTSGDDSKSQ